MTHLWSLLFGSEAALDGAMAETADWPGDLGSRPEAAVFPWLEAPGAATAWLNDAAAAQAAAIAGRPLSGPAPEVVRAVHDKAFALEAARESDLEAPSLVDLISPIDPGDLAPTERALDTLRERLARWPDWTGRNFTLKPRFGSSGRGRVPGFAGEVDTPEVRGSLPRLAARGGAMLEPWLARSGDYSSQLYVEPGGGVVLLGTLSQVMSRSGVYRGHRGLIDHRGRVTAGSRYDEDLRVAGAAVAQCAAVRGFSGPCGIDSFEFTAEAERSEMRWVVEFNARFTTGTLLIGLLRRALPTIRARLGLAPGELYAFYFALNSPKTGWPEPGDDDSALLLRLGRGGDPAGPAVLVARDRERLDALL